MAKKSTFINSFIRQMGRECAHDVYKKATTPSFTKSNEFVDDETFTTRFIFRNYFWLFICILFGVSFPPLLIIPIIMGLMRIFGRKIRGHYKDLVSQYVPDGRCRGGARYVGSYEKWKMYRKPRKECTKQQIMTARIFGILEIVLCLIVLATI